MEVCMKGLLLHLQSTAARVTLVALVLGILVGVTPQWSSANSGSTAITVANNSGLTIQHVYLSPINQNSWGSDQLNNSAIGPGSSATISTAGEGSIRVIAEDKDGCFLSAAVTCSDTAARTITNNTTRDCD